MVTVFLHCWQRTEQHQENLQEHRCTTSARPALYPGPQHTSSQPSGASREVPVLHQTILSRISELVSLSFEMVFAVDLTVTSPTGGPRNTILGIEMAEIWGGCKVEEISGSRGFYLGVPREQGRSGSYTSQTDLRGRKKTLTEPDTAGNLKGFSEGCIANVPLWRRQSVPSAQCQRAWMEASPSNRFSTRKIQTRHDTCTQPACCEGWPGGTGQVSIRVTNKNVTKGHSLPTFRPASLLWRFMSGRPADRPLARSGSSTNVWENATP